MLLGNTWERLWEKQGNVYAGRGLLTVQLQQLTLFRAAGAVQYFAFFFLLSWGSGSNGAVLGQSRESSSCRQEKQQLGLLSVETPTFLGIVVPGDVWMDPHGGANISWRLWSREMFGWYLEPRVCCRVVSRGYVQNVEMFCAGRRELEVLMFSGWLSRWEFAFPRVPIWLGG